MLVVGFRKHDLDQSVFSSLANADSFCELASDSDLSTNSPQIMTAICSHIKYIREWQSEDALGKINSSTVACLPGTAGWCLWQKREEKLDVIGDRLNDEETRDKTENQKMIVARPFSLIAEFATTPQSPIHTTFPLLPATCRFRRYNEVVKSMVGRIFSGEQQFTWTTYRIASSLLASVQVLFAYTKLLLSLLT